MSRLVAAALGLSLVASTAVLAYAATTPVDAGVLQTQTQAVDIDVPEPPNDSYVITVQALKFSSGKDPHQNGEETTSAFVPAGGSYTVSWGGSEIVSCASVGHTVTPPDVESGPGTYVATGHLTRVFCFQTGGGTGLSITVNSTASAPTSSSFTTSTTQSDPPATTTEDDDLWSSSLEDLAADACRDGGWQEMRDADLVPYDSEAACIEAEVAAYRERVAANGGTP